jgi:hypothetical protein
LPAQVGRKKPEPGRSRDDDDDDDSKKKGMSKTVMAVIALTVILGVVGLIVTAIKVMPKVQAGPRVKVPVAFEIHSKQEAHFLCEYPAEWDKTSGGGNGGVPTWANFEMGNARISIRETIKGAVHGSVMPSNDEMPEELEPVAMAHEEQRRFISENYNDYKEEPAVKFPSKFGGSLRRSEFTASAKGPFGKKLKGYRATVLNTITCFNIVCQCPEADFEALEPTFDRVINSMQAQ